MKIDEFTSITQDADGNIYVTRPSMFKSKIQTHKLATTEYSVLQLALWLSNRMEHQPNLLVQEAFPNMNAEDREFMMTGITPAEWNAMFPNNAKED